MNDELRELIREVIRDVLPKGLPVTETVNLSTDQDLSAFVARLLDLDPEARADLRAGRKRFRLAAPQTRMTRRPHKSAGGRSAPDACALCAACGARG